MRTLIISRKFEEKKQKKKTFKTFFFAVLVVYCSVYAASITLSPCAKWNKAGTTISKTGGQIQLNEEIVSPTGVFIDKLRNTLYTSDGEYTGRIHFLSLNQSSSETTVIIYGLTYPNRIFVDNDADESILYITLPYFNRVEKWFSGATRGIQIGESFRSCSGISVDVDKNVYVSESALHCISKWSPKINQTVVVAGQKGSEGGLSNSELHNPSGIYVSRSNGDIYIADTFNHRIQRWSQNMSEGITVAGSSNGTEGSDSALLNNPNAVWVDEDTDIIYIVDSFNNRIQRYYPDASESDTIAGQLSMSFKFPKFFVLF